MTSPFITASINNFNNLHCPLKIQKKSSHNSSFIYKQIFKALSFSLDQKSLLRENNISILTLIK